MCAEELDRAVALNKLVVAVHCRDVDLDDLPPALTIGESVPPELLHGLTPTAAQPYA